MSGLLDGTPVACIRVPTPFIVGPVNVYLVKQNPPILIDTGPRIPGAYEAIESGLREHGVEVRDLGSILLTHAHVDHSGQLARLVLESNARTFAHPDAVHTMGTYDATVDHALESFRAMLREMGVPDAIADQTSEERETHRPYGERVAIDHAIADGERIGNLRVHFVPGHSPSDVLFHDEETGFAFVGDHVLDTMNPNPLIRLSAPGKERAKALIEFHASLRRTRELDIAVVCPGHGEPFSHHRRVIDQLLERNARRTARVRAILDQGPKTAFEVAQSLFPDLEPAHLYLGLSVAVGHIEMLEESGQVAADNRNGVLYFRSI